MSNITENTHQGDNSLYEKTPSHFNYAPLAVLYEYVKSLDTEHYHEVLKVLMDKAKLNDEVNKQIQGWEQESPRSNRTRLVVKLINHTGQALAVGENNLYLNANEQAFINILPWDIKAFRFDFTYSRQLGSRSKDMFKHFIMFGDNNIGFRFDFGLRVNTSFGVISSTLTPIRTNKVTSFGTAPIQCSTRITHSASEEPYSFTVEITLA